ncbi:hypothetical protein LINPERPRIM_LOCUS37980 [Linum perenne]
MSCVEVMILIS